MKKVILSLVLLSTLGLASQANAGVRIGVAVGVPSYYGPAYPYPGYYYGGPAVYVGGGGYGGGHYGHYGHGGYSDRGGHGHR